MGYSDFHRLLSVCVSVKVQKSDHPHSWDPCVNYCHPANSTLLNTSATLNKSWTASNNNTINDYCKCKTHLFHQSSFLCVAVGSASFPSLSSLQLWYQPASLPVLRPHPAPAARAPAPCPGPQSPWVHETRCSNGDRGRKSTKAPVRFRRLSDWL